MVEKCKDEQINSGWNKTWDNIEKRKVMWLLLYFKMYFLITKTLRH